MNWTKGPWKVREMGGSCFVEGNEVVGRTAAGEYKREILSDEDYPSKKADAYLTSAVLDLYEAVNRLLPENYDPALNEPTQADVDFARAALAKARGEV